MMDLMLETCNIQVLYYLRYDLYHNSNCPSIELGQKINDLEFMIKTKKDGLELLQHLYKISANRMSLELDNHDHISKVELFNKIVISANICEKILNFEKYRLLYPEEKLFKQYLDFLEFTSNIKTKILLCGNNPEYISA